MAATDGRMLRLAPPAGVAPPPWYRQFWPWFIIALPAASVLFSVATLVVAIRNADSLVRDDYYRAGLAINRDFAQERAATARQLGATLRLDAQREQLAIELRGLDLDPHNDLLLALAHPTDAARDLILPLHADAQGRFHAALAAPLHGAWNAALTPAGGGWRLAARIDFDGPDAPQLGAAP
jgi:uncharacterized protein